MEGMVRMINRLINMSVPSINTISGNVDPVKPAKNGIFTMEQYAKAFINGMGETQKERFKKMLENDIKCGMSVADNYGIDYDEFITEVKKQMEV